MSIEFSTTGKKIIYLQEVGNISILLSINKSIRLLNIALIPECKSKLISLGQLRDTNFTYQDKSMRMTLIRRRKIVAYAKRGRNFFILDLIKSGKAMAMGCGRLIHIINKNKQIQIWHC